MFSQYKRFNGEEEDETSIIVDQSLNGEGGGMDKEPLIMHHTINTLSSSDSDDDNLNSNINNNGMSIHSEDARLVETELVFRRHAKHHEELRNIFASNKKNEEEIKTLKNKRQRGFYIKQNELIDQFLTPLKELSDEEEAEDFRVKVAIYGSLMVNVVLFAMQITAAIVTGSMSLVATSIDAFMDLLSGFILFMTDRARKKRNYFDYPTGKSRMEPIGIIIFAALMSTVSINLLMEGATKLINHKDGEIDLTIMSVVFVVFAILCKVGMYMYCRVLTHSSSAQILATDHRNDITVNSFGIGMAILGYYLKWWLDPIGALIVALIILRSWTSEAYEQIQLLVGKTASPEFLQRITYISLSHSPEVLKVDTCRAFHFGNNFFVEVDIVLPPDMPLSKTHDIGESLQIKLESLPEVERAFVHVDYEFKHKPEHKRVN